MMDIVIKLQTIIKKIFSHSEKSDSICVYSNLTPIDNVDDNTYINALSWAVKNKDIYNVALTGPYGSGKSSILRTFQKKHPENTYLNISLAMFGVKNEKRDIDEVNDEIEKSILQQLFYKVKQSKVPSSRFKRIKEIRFRNFLFLLLSCAIMLSTLVCIVYPELISKFIFNNMFLHVYFREYEIYMIYVLFILSFLFIVYKTIEFCSMRLSLSKVKIEQIEVEIDKKNDQSVFNKFLDEIIYFFESTKYNVILLEELDRYNNIDIFTKLRELNTLINNSDLIRRKIVFVYAIKDDMFINTERTKFFDFIIPIVPVADPSNSGELLIGRLRTNLPFLSISEKYITDITIYITEMRTLNNIYNEFVIYREKLMYHLIWRNCSDIWYIRIFTLKTSLN